MRTLADDVIQAGDRERASIARELHDSTAQTLAALLLELTVLTAQNSDPELKERIARIRSIVSDVLDEVRLLAHTVHPRVLDDLGLGAALQLLARESLERSNVRVTYSGPAKVTSIDNASASALYRVAQEAVGNAIRHARAKSIMIRLDVGASEAELEIADDGTGFSPEVVEQRRPGLGLFTMRERAALVGGRLTLQSGVGEGHARERDRAGAPCRSRREGATCDNGFRAFMATKGGGMTEDLIRVVLADDHTVVRAGLKAVLRTAKDIDVVGEARNGEEALALVDRFHPHVVVMDLSMNGMDGITATKAVVARKNGTRVLVLTMHPEEDYLVPLLEAGAAGYLVKSVADRELVDAVRAVAKRRCVRSTGGGPCAGPGIDEEGSAPAGP